MRYVKLFQDSVGKYVDTKLEYAPVFAELVKNTRSSG
jgi:hypothetical protein